MPPVLNTYGAKKKKRCGIPRIMYKVDPESNDIFESLKIDKIKETKAFVDEERRKKGKKKVLSQTKTFIPKYESCADDAFDKLLKGGSDGDISFNLTSPESSQRRKPLGESNSSDPKLFRKSANVKKEFRSREASISLNDYSPYLPSGKVRKVTSRVRRRRKKSISKDDSFFAPRPVGNSPEFISIIKTRRMVHSPSADSDKVSSVKTTDATAVTEEINSSIQNRKAKNITKDVLALSPILPAGYSSTPIGVCRRIAFRLSPTTCIDLCDSLRQEKSVVKRADESDDLFKSYEKQNVPKDKFDEGHVSVDLFSSFEKSEHLKSELKLSNSNSCSCNKLHSVVDVSNFSSHCVPTSNNKQEEFISNHCCFVNNSTCPNCVVAIDSDPVLSEEIPNETVSSSIPECIPNCSCDLVKSGRNNVEILGVNSDELSNILCGCEECSNSSLSAALTCQPVASGSQTSYTACLSRRTSNCSLHLLSMSGKRENEFSPGGRRSVGAAHHKLNVDQYLDVNDLSSHLNSMNLSSSELQESCNVTCQCRVNTSSFTSLREAKEEITLPESADSKLGECRLVLQRCDRAITGKPSMSRHESFVYHVPVDSSHKVNGHIVKSCSVLLQKCDIQTKKSQSEPQNAVSSLKCGRENEPNSETSECVRKSLKERLPEGDTIVLKPGKQWRRSLSILTKTRTSSGESSLDDTKIKGKLYESSRKSVFQMQTVQDTIREESFSSLSSVPEDGIQSCGEGFEPNTWQCRSILEVESDGAAEVYRRCGQSGPVPFSQCFPENMKKDCSKIGEGVYGEVFLHSGSKTRRSSVIKIIPIEGQVFVNGEPQKTFAEILSEVCVAQELSKLRFGMDNVTHTFNEVQAIRCVQGRYPQWLLDLWCEYDDLKGSENDSPEMFGDDQLYIILELSNGGKDLESFVFSSAMQGLAAFRQVALTLAVGESALNFEHRDLHWGNVLISCVKEEDVTYVLNGQTLSTPSKGIKVSIIDFTLSRITDPQTGKPIFFDMGKDETLFTATGDYQFEIYRMMKDFCLNRWDVFTPKTNIAWLHYLLDKLCTMARYRNRTSKVHQQALNTLSEMKEIILDFPDVVSFVTSNLF